MNYNTITVFIKNGDATTLITGLDPRRGKYMSDQIRQQIEDGGFAWANDRKSVMFQDIDLDAARTIVKWINTFDTYGDFEEQWLTQAHAGSDEFTKIVDLQSAARGFGIGHKFRGDFLRQDIIQYIKMAPLTVNEFIQVHERLGFDGELIDETIKATVGFKLSKYPPPQMAQIEQYAQSAGLGKHFADLERHISRTMKIEAMAEERLKEESERGTSPTAATTKPAGETWASKLK